MMTDFWAIFVSLFTVLMYAHFLFSFTSPSYAYGSICARVCLIIVQMLHRDICNLTVRENDEEENIERQKEKHQQSPW